MEKGIYFISDLHLGAKYLNDERKYEQRVVSWLDSIKNSASEIYLLGDILDYWYEYRYVVPKGFTRFFGKIAELSDMGIKIYWFIGNHDIWIFDYLPSELGIDVIDGSMVKNIYGKKFFLSHGDGVGHLKPGFRLIRSVFRNKFCQFLFSSIHPRWTIPFAHSWSSKSRDSHEGKDPAIGDEIKSLKQFAIDYSEHNDIDYFVFGHLHCIVNEKINDKSTMVVLGDWINLFSYAYYDGDSLIVERLNK
ncbi:MAG: UDP-2,3-diacylglucosamine diphosphatase [Muribaculaceae bacterium]|nr:UDP-2,3-diacylglucosamine diphosphatase [Muribaculaceae bacterium]